MPLAPWKKPSEHRAGEGFQSRTQGESTGVGGNRQTLDEPTMNRYKLEALGTNLIGMCLIRQPKTGYLKKGTIS